MCDSCNLEIIKGLAFCEGRLEPLGLKAAAGPGFAGKRVAVFGFDLRSSPGTTDALLTTNDSLREGASNVRNTQSVFRNDGLKLRNTLFTTCALSFTELAFKVGGLAFQVGTFLKKLLISVGHSDCV